MTTPAIIRLLDIYTIRLSAGGHDDPGDVDIPTEMCLDEAVAWMAGEEWTRITPPVPALSSPGSGAS